MAGKTTQETIDQMFVKLDDGLIHCKLCNKHLKSEDLIEVEFWRHQIQRNHLDQLIQCYLILNKAKSLKTGSTLQNKNKSTTEEIHQSNQSDKQEFVNPENSEPKGNEQFNLNQFKDIDLSDLVPQDNFDMQYKIQKENLIKSNFKYQCKLYFDRFIKELMNKGYSIEAFCYILGRLGLATTDICVMTFDQMEIQIQQRWKKSIICTEIKKQFDETFIKLKERFKVENNNYFFKQPKPPKKIRTMLESVRKFLINQTQDIEYQKFLYRASIRAFVAIYNSIQDKLDDKKLKKYNKSVSSDLVIPLSLGDDDQELQNKIQKVLQDNEQNDHKDKKVQKIIPKLKPSFQKINNKKVLKSQ